ncbi:MAG TPA: glycosyltransferase family 4 protein [Chthoniobacter sp.]|jgi:glycosyltransferase involved in cell wall biosynthesis
MNHGDIPKVFLATAGAWYLRQTSQALAAHDALAALWITDKNSTGLPAGQFRRCWPFHLAIKPFYHFAPQIWTEKAFYGFFPIWRQWFRSQEPPSCNVVHAIMGFATEPFDVAERIGALKVVDCPNSHPTTYFGHWQRECDLWCPGEKVPIPRWMFARMNRELERADMILCPSTFVRDSMLQNNIPAEKLFVNPFGVDTQIFKPRPMPPEKPRFISVGTICLRKGFQYLFRAFEKVKSSVPDAELICLGDYKTDFRLERRKWAGTFTHIPHVSHAKLAEVLATGTAFVFPSVEEGFARVIAEAMAASLPILASHESGASTLVENDKEGFIVSPRDTEGLAEKMVLLARDRELNRKMGEAAHQKGAASNTWQDYGDRLLAEFSRRLADRKDSATPQIP